MYEGLKKQFNSELMATEVCLRKCNAIDGNASFSDEQQTCLRECTLKYFDSSMLVELEMSRFAKGVPL